MVLAMAEHHTKLKGDLGVLKAQVDLFEQGFTILAPLTEHAPFDLVAYRDGEYRRIQVKFRKLDKHGKLDVKFSTCWADRKGTHTVPIDKSEVDLYCIYCPDTDECYYLNPDAYGSNATLRVETPKNGQRKNVKFAADCRRVP
jgi:hypothetical protein